MMSIFASRILNGQPPLIFEDGRQSRDFTHVRDVVQGLMSALTSQVAQPGTINLGSGRCISVLDVARTLIRDLGASFEPQITGRFRAGDVRCCYAHIVKARDLLGYRPFVSLEAGVAELTPWRKGRVVEDRTEQAMAQLENHGVM